jgi:hypothetical protein
MARSTPPIPNGGAVGIDLGIARFATLSDGTSIYAPLNSFKRHETALRQAQRAMSRKVKFSHNWKKAKARVQRIHSRIGHARRDFLHKTSTAISQNHAMVCIEDLQVNGTCPSRRQGHHRAAGQERSGQIRFEQVHPRPRLVRVPPPVGLQAGLERRLAHRRTTAQYQSNLPVLRACVSAESPDTSAVLLRGMRLRGQRRRGRRDQCSKGGTRPVRL